MISLLTLSIMLRQCYLELSCRKHNTCEPLFAGVNIRSVVSMIGKICQRPTTVLKVEVAMMK